MKLFREIEAAGFDGDYGRVTEFVRCWRQNGGQALVKAFVPLSFELGEAFRFDWSEEHLDIGGVWRKILAAHLKLCASRAFVVLAYPTQSHEMLFDAQKWSREIGRRIREETIADILWHTRQGMTAHYSVAQIEELVEALNRITDERSRINRSLDMIRRERVGFRVPKSPDEKKNGLDHF